jgi:L-aminopeptidase/D-esterase-like protein
VRDTVIAWSLKHEDPKNYSGDLSLPVVAETYDGFLNDINGFHVKPEHVIGAIESARGGPVAEGNVGGGTGMIAHGFKGGIGTSSRVVKIGDTTFTLGVLVQANYGRRDNLHIAGVPLGPIFPDLTPTRGAPKDGQGSIVIIIATDTPLLPHQLRRIAERASLGVAIVGGRGENSSGDLFLAFSTADATEASKLDAIAAVHSLPNEQMNPLFNATVNATEEAIVNALVAAETMTGADGNTVYALPHDRLQAALRKFGRLVEK